MPSNAVCHIRTYTVTVVIIPFHPLKTPQDAHFSPQVSGAYPLISALLRMSFKASSNICRDLGKLDMPMPKRTAGQSNSNFSLTIMQMLYSDLRNPAFFWQSTQGRCLLMKVNQVNHHKSWWNCAKLRHPHADGNNGISSNLQWTCLLLPNPQTFQPNFSGVLPIGRKEFIQQKQYLHHVLVIPHFSWLDLLCSS